MRAVHSCNSWFANKISSCLTKISQTYTIVLFKLIDKKICVPSGESSRKCIYTQEKLFTCICICIREVDCSLGALAVMGSIHSRAVTTLKVVIITNLEQKQKSA